jgi:hypothetical protein
MDQVNNCPTTVNYTDAPNEKSMQPSPDWVMICTPTLTTRGGEIIQISPGRVQIQKTQHKGHTIKLNPTGSLTTLLPHTGLHKSNTKLHRFLD